mmetsp:Transcript_13319/g.35334  ORF Transcript_13319/g.35334 Transcript_13319/m.35334 type:complete len:246 (+) Transcript_13319:196-933(+)
MARKHALWPDDQKTYGAAFADPTLARVVKPAGAVRANTGATSRRGRRRGDACPPAGGDLPGWRPKAVVPMPFRVRDGFSFASQSVHSRVSSKAPGNGRTPELALERVRERLMVGAKSVLRATGFMAARASNLRSRSSVSSLALGSLSSYHEFPVWNSGSLERVFDRSFTHRTRGETMAPPRKSERSGCTDSCWLALVFGLPAAGSGDTRWPSWPGASLLSCLAKGTALFGEGNTLSCCTAYMAGW